ncbi:MAG: hypothetical protein REI95_10825 [Oxalicibacterium faecigallinarum]|uniref:hypothetical protein n=1 Tax=Oxalicibacterium faecigallinarum TaxID=573741 RepID=UPI002809F80E|nr:hypothetical protein [Oxalicibacterium faecigallinarum]MDQ7970126.1 hypothetical protein [Oxalicibacterium faecigallinarum]
MSERKIEKTNSDRMVEKNRAHVPQPVRAGTGPESMSYQQRTGVYVENDPANKPAGSADVPKKVPDQPAYEKTTVPASDRPTSDK